MNADDHPNHVDRVITAVRDRGSVDVSVEMLFGMIAVLAALVVIFETTAYWHARNIYDDAAAEGVRVAAAFDGSCADGIAVTREAIARHAGGWARDIAVVCTDGQMVSMEVRGPTPGISARAIGAQARVVETAPRER